ncbi:MAG: hypothetical protein IPK80_05850 [Nannocystis sp.]|nr:hypothetical protein [Nannocystis sp.]
MNAPAALALLLGLITAPQPAGDPEDRPGVEVVRIKRDFGKPHFDLALDAWPDPTHTRIDHVRLRWVNTSEHDRRKPLGPIASRLVQLRVHRDADRRLSVTVTGDDKEFLFHLELTPEGAIQAHVAAVGEGGQPIPKCRAEAARLITHRVFGLPTGLAHIEVLCLSDRGEPHTAAKIDHRQLDG